MADTTTIPRGTPCGRTVLLTGAGVAAGGGAIAFVIDHSATILNGIFLAVTFGHFWPSVIIHFAAAMLCAYWFALAFGVLLLVRGWMKASDLRNGRP
jgi:hypothetical protein